jgi:hypothetical protein
MPVDSILVAAALVAVFAIFSVVWIWSDSQSEAMRRGPADRPWKRRSF